MNRQHVDLVAGEDRTLSFEARDYLQNVKDITGATISWRMARQLGCDNVLEKTGTITDADDGLFTVTLTDDDTTDLSGDYEHIANVTIAGVTTAVVYGRFRVRDNIA